MTKLEMLTQSKEMREEEVAQYEHLIDTYTLAIEHSVNNPEMAEYREHLQNLLAANLREQSKAQLMLDVVLIQIAQLQAQ